MGLMETGENLFATSGLAWINSTTEPYRGLRLTNGGAGMRREERVLPFNHPIAIYLRSAAGRDSRLSSLMVKQLDLDPTTVWRFESVTWEPPGAAAHVTLRALFSNVASANTF